MHNEHFLAAAIPDPVTILGRRLLPLSIGHLFFLQRFNCAPVESIDDLVRAVIICSHPVEEVLGALEDPWLPFKLRFWGWKIRRRHRRERGWAKRPLEPFHRAMSLWREYLEAGQEGPSVCDNGETGGVAGAPWLQHLRVTLMSKLGYSPREALTIPYSQALWDYHTYWENEGQVSIAGGDRADMRELANAMDAQIRAAVEKMTPPGGWN